MTVVTKSTKSFLLVLAINAGVGSVQAGDFITGISGISESDVRDSAIAFVNMSVSPGLEGATLRVDSEGRESEQTRGSLGFSAEVTIKKYTFNGYWGFAVVAGSLNDKIDLIADNGQPVNLDVTRDVLGLRGSLGLSFPINQHFKLRPFVSLIFSDLETETTVDGLISIGPTPGSAFYKTEAQIASTVGSIDAIYSRWYGDNRLELSAQYNLIYTDTISADNPVLDSYDWHQTAQLKSRFSGPARFSTSGRPWRWQVYANHSNFMSQNKAALGYTGLFEIGTGLDWHMNIKPLNWFGWQVLGISVGVITSRDVEGYNVGLTAR